jgi:hypothetical protein
LTLSYLLDFGRLYQNIALEQSIMSLSPPHAYADQLAAAIQHAIQAHTYFPNTPRDAIRLWDRQTPYVVHPIWCAMTLLTETNLTEDIRYPSAIALLWHDTLKILTCRFPRIPRRLFGSLSRK